MERGRRNRIDPEKTLRDKTRDWRTRADGGGVAGRTADKNSRFLRGESIFFFVRESEMSRKSPVPPAAIWIFCSSSSSGSRIDAPLNPRPPDDHAQPGCTVAQTGFSGVLALGGGGRGGARRPVL